MHIVLAVVTLFAVGGLVAVLYNGQVRRRETFVREYIFPMGLYEKLKQRRPDLTNKDCALVSRALRQFFLAFAKSRGQFVAMPSQVADDLWHEFILFTRNYERFCRHAFGRFLHHTPAVALSTAQKGNEGIRRTWWFACKEENIDPRKPSRLPLLFALDAKLGITDGFHYSTDCHRSAASGDSGGSMVSPYCAGDITTAGCGGFGCGGGGASGSSDGSGCGGGGCGGGD